MGKYISYWRKKYGKATFLGYLFNVIFHLFSLHLKMLKSIYFPRRFLQSPKDKNIWSHNPNVLHFGRCLKSYNFGPGNTKWLQPLFKPTLPNYLIQKQATFDTAFSPWNAPLRPKSVISISTKLKISFGKFYISGCAPSLQSIFLWKRFIHPT